MRLTWAWKALSMSYPKGFRIRMFVRPLDIWDFTGSGFPPPIKALPNAAVVAVLSPESRRRFPLTGPPRCGLSATRGFLVNVYSHFWNAAPVYWGVVLPGGLGVSNRGSSFEIHPFV